jgi:2-polyprenyl-6-methoxyphenol hydroxylase-like FAD-dependent oxidoreductase
VIRTVIVGAGMTGLTLARLLRARGQEPIVVERGPAGPSNFTELMPEGAEAVEGVCSWDQVRYVEPRLLRCPRWWSP